MYLNEHPDDRHQLRLRGLIESWEREGLIGHEIAARALAVTPHTTTNSGIELAPQLRRLELLGYLGAVPIIAAGLLLAGSHVGAGPVMLVGLLIAVASPRTIRASQRRTAQAGRGVNAARHRASQRRGVPGPKAHRVVPIAHVETPRATANLAATTSY